MFGGEKSDSMSVVIASDISFILASVTSEPSQAVLVIPSHVSVSADFQLSYPLL